MKSKFLFDLRDFKHRSFKNFKYKKSNHCLLDTASIEENFKDDDLSKIYPGQIYDVDDQCKLLHGNNSSACMVM